jgi:cytochrome c2
MPLIIAIFMSLILAACDNVSPEEGRQAIHLPPPGFQGDTNQGYGLFQQFCATCHGIDGKGNEQGPPLVHPVYRPAHHADLTFHMAVRNGVQPHHWKFGKMPSQPDVTPEDIEHVIAYIRQEQRRAGIL